MSANIDRFEPDAAFMQQAITQALIAEAAGNLPVGAVIVLENEIIAAAGSAILAPYYHPGKHAESECLGQIKPELWSKSRGMTCYTTLEPCVMCFGALLLHGVGRIVFGALDREGGASALLDHLPDFYSKLGNPTPQWIGPVMPERCDELYERARSIFPSIK